MSGFDYNSYQEYFQQILEPVIQMYKKDNYGVKERSDVKDIVWRNYAKFNRHCREEYMKNPESLTDRHKVIACYMCAILKSDILISTLSIQQDEEMHMLLNERLALCYGMTMLRALIRGNARKISDAEMRDKVLEVFDGEMAFPKVNHGAYKQNLLLQLYHTRKEGNYNILALANELFHIENYNLITNGLPEDLFKT